MNRPAGTSPTSLLSAAPTDPADLPAWLAGLSRRQLDSVWVAAVVDLHTRSPLTVRDLAAALSAVRDRTRHSAAQSARRI